MVFIPGKSIVPLLSASTSLIMSWSSDSEGFWPSERMTVPSSLVVIWPSYCSACMHDGKARIHIASRFRGGR